MLINKPTHAIYKQGKQGIMSAGTIDEMLKQYKALQEGTSTPRVRGFG